jgi:hypothetical protein
MLFRGGIFLLLGVGSTVSASVNYDGYQVFRIETDGDAAAVSDKLADVEHNQWSFGAGGHIDVSVPGGEVEKLKKMGFKYKQMHTDLGKAIKEEKTWKKYTGRWVRTYTF